MDRTPVSLVSPFGGSGSQQAMGRSTDGDRIKPSVSSPSLSASTPRSHVPASLGIGTPNPPTKSLRERLRLSRTASTSSAKAQRKPTDGLQFSNAEPVGRSAGEFGSFPSLPSWGPQGSRSLSGPQNGSLPVSSSTGSLGSASGSSSRNFLVPIGATGARQKLSIANASQRRRLAVSEDAPWSPESATTTHTAQHPDRNGMGLQRSQSEFHSLGVDNSAPAQVLNRSSSFGIDGRPAGSTASSNDATPAELMQQAAMQRLSSQRILPSKNRSVSENITSTPSTALRPAQPVSASRSPAPQLAALPSSASEGRSQAPAAIKAVPAISTARATSITVPDRTASTIKPSPRGDSLAASQTGEEPRSGEHIAREVDSSISSRPLTIAETYKRAMLERDAERARLATRSEPVLAKPTPVPSQATAPMLDLDLPSSAFFYDDDVTAPADAPVIAPRSTSAPAARMLDTSVIKTPERTGASTASPVTPTNGTTSQRFAALASTSPPGSGPVLPSLQSSYDEAMKIQDRIRRGVNDEPEYGGLFDSSTSPFAQSSTQPSIDTNDRSYLALRDEGDDSLDQRQSTTAKPAVKEVEAKPAPTTQQIQPQVQQTINPPTMAKAPSATPEAAAPMAPAAPVTPPADKSFVQLSTPDLDADSATLKKGLESYRFTPTRTAEQTPTRTVQAAPIRAIDEDDRPNLPRVSSLQTLQSPPNKLEQQPGPQEEAALRAGASAAQSTSPVVATPEANASRQLGAASPAINGDRTLRAGGEGHPSARWTRDVSAVQSPAQQSRFSEASTDLNDSRAPTRNENRYSGRASSVSSADGLEEESNDGHMLPTSAWQEVENALRRFRDRSMSAPQDRGHLLRAVLLPFLALEAETVTVEVVGSGIYTKGKARRALFFDWIRSLLLELQHVQTSADRGAILESIACIIESRNFSASILSTDPEDEARFSSVFGHILSYAIGELNKKGVYQNTLIFSGRLLAVAFFRVNGVASKLLRALPVNRFALERVAREFEWQKKRPTDFNKFVSRFPATLRQLCYKDSREYLKMLDSESIAGAGNGGDSNEDDRFLVCQPEVEVEMSGNWLRRWQSDDSELFFSFCRSYHRQLASLFASSKTLENSSKYFFGGPGYAHLATCVHQKCLALVHRVILSVTTLSSQKNFNPAGETANVLSGSTAGKPRILEAANRRCTAIVVDIVRAPAGANMIFAPMLGLHIKALIKRTSLYDVQGVFCLLDWLDGVISHMDSNDLINEGLIDISFIITTIGMLLENADHALALMRTIAFCYANFGVLTATTENRVYFCEQILLKPAVFHKLFLSWSFTIRAYYLHLLVFRLARIRDFPAPKDDPSGRTAVRVVRLFNQRLETLRKRHDTLSPEIDSSSDDTKSEDSKSRKSGTSTFVSTIKRASTDGGTISSEGSADGRPKAEKIMGMTAVEPAVPVKPEHKKGHSKTKSWLKAFRGNSYKTESKSAGNSPRTTSGFSPSGKVLSPESDDDSKTIGSAKTTPRTSFDSTSSDTMSDVSTLAGSIRAGKTGKPGSGYEFDIKQQQASQQQQQSSKSQSGANAAAGALDPGLAKDTVFDLQSNHAQHPPTPGRTPQSPRVSKAFSRRASMLPGPASELVASMMDGEDEIPPVPELPTDQFGLGLSGMNGQPSSEVYEETLHIYAVQSLREYEQTVQEHDEFFASLAGDQSAQVPRLPVNWPAMWSSTGE